MYVCLLIPIYESRQTRLKFIVETVETKKLFTTCNAATLIDQPIASKMLHKVLKTATLQIYTASIKD